VLFKRAQCDFPVGILESLGREKEDPETGTADIVELGKVDNK
jgi:hypothetical protein